MRMRMTPTRTITSPRRTRMIRTATAAAAARALMDMLAALKAAAQRAPSCTPPLRKSTRGAEDPETTPPRSKTRHERKRRTGDGPLPARPTSSARRSTSSPRGTSGSVPWTATPPRGFRLRTRWSCRNSALMGKTIAFLAQSVVGGEVDVFTVPVAGGGHDARLLRQRGGEVRGLDEKRTHFGGDDVLLPEEVRTPQLATATL